MALNSLISIWSSKESSCSISSSFSLSLCLSLSFLRSAVKLDIIVIIKHHHHREHHQHHHYLRSAVKMDILLDALLIFSWFFEGLSPSITYMGRWVLQNSDLQASASALFQWKILRYSTFLWEIGSLPPTQTESPYFPVWQRSTCHREILLKRIKAW